MIIQIHDLIVCLRLFSCLQLDIHLSFQIIHHIVIMIVVIVIEILIDQIEEVLIDHLHLTGSL